MLAVLADFKIQFLVEQYFKALFPHDKSLISLLAWTQNEINSI